MAEIINNFISGYCLNIRLYINEKNNLYTMAYQSRKRNYKSQREKYQRTTRNIRTTVIFILIALAVWVFKKRYEIWPDLNTWFQ